MLKKIFFSTVFFITLLLFHGCSCAANRRDAAPIAPDTIRDTIIAQYEQMTWVEEIHPEGVGKKNIKSKEAQMPELLDVLVSDKPIYPHLEGFGSLDTSILPTEVLDVLDLFFSMAALPDKPNRTIDKELLTTEIDFLPFILNYHLSRMHEVSYTLYGKAEELENSFQVPVRFQGDYRYTDANVFISKADLSYLIDQIQFSTAIEQEMLEDSSDPQDTFVDDVSPQGDVLQDDVSTQEDSPEMQELQDE
ncbi:MAG: hypothetical protein ACRC4W_04785 [Treponemataceae bacterium]